MQLSGTSKLQKAPGAIKTLFPTFTPPHYDAIGKHIDIITDGRETFFFPSIAANQTSLCDVKITPNDTFLIDNNGSKMEYPKSFTYLSRYWYLNASMPHPKSMTNIPKWMKNALCLRLA